MKIGKSEKRILNFMSDYNSWYSLHTIGEVCGYGAHWAKTKCDRLVSKGLLTKNGNQYKVKTESE